MRRVSLILGMLGGCVSAIPLAYAQSQSPSAIILPPRVNTEMQGVDIAPREPRTRPLSPLDSGLNREKPQDQLQRVIDYNATREKNREAAQERVKGTSEEFKSEDKKQEEAKAKKRRNKRNSATASPSDAPRTTLKAGANALGQQKETPVNFDPTPVAPLPTENRQQTSTRLRSSTVAPRTDNVILPPTMERPRYQPMASLSDSRTGRPPYTNKNMPKEKKVEKPPNRTGLGRVMLQSEQEVYSRNSSFHPLIRPLPLRAMQTPLSVDRKGVMGKQNANANPLAQGAIIDPFTGRVIPRVTSKYFDKDKASSILVGNAAAPVTAPTPERDIYAPHGIKQGNLTYLPAVETAVGYETNPLRQATPKGSLAASIAPELVVNADLPRHNLSADLRGTYTAYQAYPNVHRLSFSGSVSGRLDFTADQSMDLNLRASAREEQATAASYGAAAGTTLTNSPLAIGAGVTVGYTKEFNRLALTLRGLFDRSQFGEAQLSTGTSVSGSDRAYNTYRVAARASYLMSEQVRPFVEGYEETRVFDMPLRGGFMQGSQAFGGKVGVRFQAPRRFMGEIAIGYQTRDNKEITYKDTGGLIMEAALVYMPTTLTTVSATVKTAFEEAVSSGVSAVYRRDFGLGVDHAFYRNLIGSAKIGYGYDSYLGTSGHDERFSGSLALTYRLSTSFNLRGEIKHEQSKAYSATGIDFKSSSFMLALRAQR